MDFLQQQLEDIKKAAASPQTTVDSSSVTSSYGLSPGDISTTNTVTTSVSNYTEPILYVRSRNIEFDSHSLKPTTRFYPFFSDIDISKYVVPKLLEIEMVSGVFEAGEVVESDATFTTSKIIFRLCSLNHKTGVYDVPETTYPFNPYTQQELGNDYSSSSTILNIDTKALSLPSETDFYGSVEIGMRLIGRTSGAVATVSNVRLITDRSGRLIGSFFIPNPAKFGNIKFINGVNIFTLIDVDNLNLLSESESFSESDYSSSAVNNVSEVNILTTRNVNITFPSLVTRTGNNVKISSTVTKGTSQVSQIESQRESVLNQFTNTLDGQQNIILAPDQVSSLESQSSNLANQILVLDSSISTSTNSRRITEDNKRLAALRRQKQNIDSQIINVRPNLPVRPRDTNTSTTSQTRPVRPRPSDVTVQKSDFISPRFPATVRRTASTTTTTSSPSSPRTRR
jgi:hypothetical protein